MTRREVIKLIFGVAVATMMFQDQETAEDYPETRTRLLRLSHRPNYRQIYPEGQEKDILADRKRGLMVQGGLGCVDSYLHAVPMAACTDKTTNYVVTSFQGKTPLDMAQMILDHQEQFSGERIYYGHSNGTPSLLLGFQELARQGLAEPITCLMANCSPSSIEDADNWLMAEVINFLGSIGYKGGDYSKLIYQIYNHGLSHFGTTLHDAFEGEPLMPWYTDLAMLVDFDLMSNLDLYDGIITPETTIVYFKSKRDGVVKVDQACEAYRAFAAHFGAQFIDRDLPDNAPHADSNAASKVVSFLLREGKRLF